MPKYIVYLEPAEEGGYIVSCPDFPGCVTQGETAEEALQMVKDAIEGYIASLKKHGEAIPKGIGEGVERVEVIQVVQV
jgi:predicted RNase H-like HicB family nuclease